MELYKYRYNIYNYLFLDNIRYKLTYKSLNIKKSLLYLVIALLVIIFSFQHREMNILIMIFVIIMMILYYYKLFDVYREVIWNFIYGILILIFIIFFITSKTINSQIIIFMILMITFVYINERLGERWINTINSKYLNEYREYYEIFNKIYINNIKILEIKDIDGNNEISRLLGTSESLLNDYYRIHKKILDNIKFHENLLEEDMDDFINNTLIVNNDILKYIDIYDKSYKEIRVKYLYVPDRKEVEKFKVEYDGNRDKIEINIIKTYKIENKDVYEIDLEELNKNRRILVGNEFYSKLYDDVMKRLGIRDLNVILKEGINIDKNLLNESNEYVKMFNYLIISIIILLTMILHIFFHSLYNPIKWIR